MLSVNSCFCQKSVAVFHPKHGIMLDLWGKTHMRLDQTH